MMMIGEQPRLSNPTVQIPSWDPFFDEPTSPLPSPFSNAASSSPFLDSLTALHRYLPSNESDSLTSDDFDLPVDAYSCDQFRMYEFKVRRCARGRSHDWTECPYAHPGEKARRRDPRRYHYSGIACPDFRKGGCRKGDTCEFAHGVFECWLHPARYRTQPCKDGPACRRQVCFFAHTPDQLRILPQASPRSGSGDMEIGSPLRHHLESYLTKAGSFGSSPTSILASPPSSPPSDSPPISPSSHQVIGGSFGSFNSPGELAVSMRSMQLGKMKLGHGSWGMQNGFGSPRGVSSLRPNFYSLPSTPTRVMSRVGPGQLDFWDSSFDEEPVMERVESGRDLRAKIYAKLSKENSLDRVDPAPSAPDVGWVSELVK
ncbi:zinc finger CCCH domain-containing protein 20-like [Mercurialis annua]|uniref:zinc finger CCCH domain-containing protein 20-like n=1 Tax=Mercurialis annua TaxID=3986 RepID=UPI002160CDDA|nr:zinc finger CCCH domain-containing protein 20-like [Mercurialis annua]